MFALTPEEPPGSSHAAASASAPTPPSAPPPARRRRRKVTHTCRECRRRKVRCDRSEPCARCVKAGVAAECTYDDDDDHHAPASAAAAAGRRGGVGKGPRQVVFHAKPEGGVAKTRMDTGEAGIVRGAVPERREVDLQWSQPSVHPAPPAPAGAARSGSPRSADAVVGSGGGGAGGVAAGGGDQNGQPRRTPRWQLAWNGSRAVDTFVEPIGGRELATPKEVFRGVNGGPSTYWGRSHGATSVYQFPDAIKFLLASKDSEVQSLYGVAPPPPPGTSSASTRVDRNHGLPTPADQADASELRLLLPARDTCDRLVALYRDNFESCFRIVHLPYFMRGYRAFWDAQPPVVGPVPAPVSATAADALPTPAFDGAVPSTSSNAPPASASFVACLLCICALGACFVPPTSPDASLDLDNVSIQWITAVQNWVTNQTSPRINSTLGYMQAHSLVLLASGMRWLHTEASWVSSGTLVRLAVAAGLHRDPADFVKVSPFWAELRRRLWYSVLELDLQLCLDQGHTTTLVRDADFDTRPPRDVDDDALREGMEAPPTTTSTTTATTTQCSAQLVLARSWRLRARVCRLVNALDLEVGYDEVLRLDAELGVVMCEARRVGAAAADDGKFRAALLEDLVLKALLCLHRPFAERAGRDARFLYSSSAVVDVAVAVLTTSLGPDAGEVGGGGGAGDDDGPVLFGRLVNICRGNITKALQVLCYDLLQQARQRHSRQQQQQYSLTHAHYPNTSSSAIPYPNSTAAATTTASWTTPPPWQAQQQDALIALLERGMAALRYHAWRGRDERSHRIAAWLQIATVLARTAARGEDRGKGMEAALRGSLRDFEGVTRSQREAMEREQMAARQRQQQQRQQQMQMRQLEQQQMDQHQHQQQPLGVGGGMDALPAVVAGDGQTVLDIDNDPFPPAPGDFGTLFAEDAQLRQFLELADIENMTSWLLGSTGL